MHASVLTVQIISIKLLISIATQKITAINNRVLPRESCGRKLGYQSPNLKHAVSKVTFKLLILLKILKNKIFNNNNNNNNNNRYSYPHLEDMKAHRGYGCKDPHIHSHDTKLERGRVVSRTLVRLYLLGNPLVLILQEAEWTPGSVWTQTKKNLYSLRHRDRTWASNSQPSALPPELPGPQ